MRIRCVLDASVNEAIRATELRNNFFIWLFFVSNTDDALTDTLVSANILLLFAAGIETSAIAFSCCLYELALNSSIQDKVRAEIREVTQNSKLDYDAVCNNLPYLDMVVSGT